MTIITGGQTGVDRAALDFAIEYDIQYSGWCPSGRLAEDGKIHGRYHLQETADTDYLTRTRLNVQGSDGTLILNREILDGGTAATVNFAVGMKKPYLIINLEHPPDTNVIHDWLAVNKIRKLNIAGPRESKCPGIYRQVLDFLRTLFPVQDLSDNKTGTGNH